MTSRYKTEGEKEGVKRRVNNHAARLREAGLLSRKIWANDAEIARLRLILAFWRHETIDDQKLNEAEKAAIYVLRPTEAAAKY